MNQGDSAIRLLIRFTNIRDRRERPANKFVDSKKKNTQSADWPRRAGRGGGGGGVVTNVEVSTALCHADYFFHAYEVVPE